MAVQLFPVSVSLGVSVAVSYAVLIAVLINDLMRWRIVYIAWRGNV